MTSFSIFGTRGGIGTSTFGWAFAQEIQATAFLDYSIHQSAAWIFRNVDSDFSWPNTLDSNSSAFQLLQTIQKAPEVHGIKVFSGGIPIPAVEVDDSLTLVFDGNRAADFRLLHTTNSIQDIETSWDQKDFRYVVLREVSGGVPTKLIQEKFNYSYRSERSVHLSVSNGLGLHPRSNVSLTARNIYADICRDFPNSH